MKTNLEKFFELLIQKEIIKIKRNNPDKTIAELREESIDTLKTRGLISLDYE
jgi:hypothetical protein